MKTAYKITFAMSLIASLVSTHDARAETISFVLDNLILEDGEQITGTFDWTFSSGDFGGGTGEFAALDIPYTIYSLADGNLITNIQNNSLEISGDGNYHDTGLDITLFLLQPFVAFESVAIDLGPSFFECCGNGFKDQPFQSGSISPTFDPADTDKDGDVDTADLTTMFQNFTGDGAWARR